MKKLLFLLVCTIIICACSPNQQNQNFSDQTSSSVSADPSINLDLQALMNLVKTSRDATDIERKLNQPYGINNCDLDNDGKVDYIKVVEYGNMPVVGYKFYATLQTGDKLVAQIELNKNSNTANIQGNPSYYGNNNNYQSSFTLTDWIILSYMFSPHSYYVSPYRYGYYGSYYSPYSCVSRSSYYSRPYVVNHTTVVHKIVIVNNNAAQGTKNNNAATNTKSNYYTKPSQSSSYKTNSNSSSSSRSYSSGSSHSYSSSSRGGFGGSSHSGSSSS